jgi:hypothetical protein
MSKKLPIFLFLVLFILECKKKENKSGEATPGTSIQSTPATQIYAGNSSMVVVTDINPDTTLWSYNQSISYDIDLNKDGYNDVRFTGSNGHLACASNGTFSAYGVQTLRSDVFILADSNYITSTYTFSSSTTQTTTVNAIYPRIVNLDDTIASNSKWRQGSIALYSDQYLPCVSQLTSSGAWKGKDQKYIGIKLGGRLGWIKTGIPIAKLKLYEFALSN